MNIKLTDKTFWKKYWENKKGVVFQIAENYAFHSIFKRLKKDHAIKNSIEIGGFPGYHSVYLKKYLQIEPALLDYFVHKEILDELIKSNGLQPADVKVIEADLFEFQPQKQYDLVFSFGLIEHFEDTQDIVGRHLPYMKPGGMLLLNLPNFRGINGWFQRKFDMDNYNKHFIQSMDIERLRKVCKNLGLEDIKVYYYGHFSIWLENYASQPLWARAFFKTAWFTGKVIAKTLSLDNKLFSPYIFVEAKMPAKS